MQLCGSNWLNQRSEKRSWSRSYKERNLKLPHWIVSWNDLRTKWSTNSLKNTSCRSSRRPRQNDSTSWRICPSKWNWWAALTWIGCCKVLDRRIVSLKWCRPSRRTLRRQLHKYIGSRAKRLSESTKSLRRRQKRSSTRSRRWRSCELSFKCSSLTILQAWICGKTKF